MLKLSGFKRPAQERICSLISCAGQRFATWTFHDGHAGIGRSQIDAEYFCHRNAKLNFRTTNKQQRCQTSLSYTICYVQVTYKYSAPLDLVAMSDNRDVLAQSNCQLVTSNLSDGCSEALRPPVFSTPVSRLQPDIYEFRSLDSA